MPSFPGRVVCRKQGSDNKSRGIDTVRQFNNKKLRGERVGNKYVILGAWQLRLLFKQILWAQMMCVIF